MAKPQIVERSLYAMVTGFEERIFFLPNNISYQYQAFEKAMQAAAKFQIEEYPLACDSWEYAYTETGTPFMFPSTKLKMLTVSNQRLGNTVQLPASLAGLFLMSETFLSHLITFDEHMKDSDVDLYDRMLDDVVLFCSELGYMDRYEKLTS